MPAEITGSPPQFVISILAIDTHCCDPNGGPAITHSIVVTPQDPVARVSVVDSDSSWFIVTPPSLLPATLQYPDSPVLRGVFPVTIKLPEALGQLTISVILVVANVIGCTVITLS